MASSIPLPVQQSMSIAGPHDEDEDSLFGSPPPSPGRPASPALALPSGYSGSSMATAPTQNVGTIALPGSHPDSELPMNPLALSLNHGIVQRPPAPPPMTSHGARTSIAGPSHHRNASASSSKPNKRPRVASRPEPPPKPAGPEFALPDPSAPPPLHFLRNQQNLLGRAGMIAGVKPAALTHIRGSTPSNPILVDDEDDRPTLGRRAQSREKSQPYIDPSLLTAPTNQEIVSVLIGQKDIFPILEGVLKLVMGNTTAVTPSPTGFARGSGQPTVKKRKLNRVPAGASDWDVPYPFQLGEGPEAYRKNWERERGKQLISQLIKLIKNAARKAATKKYLQEQKDKEQSRTGADRKPLCTEKATEVKINGYYRPETTYGLDVLQDASNAPCVVRTSDPAIHPPSIEMDPTMAAAFDQLMSSLDSLPDQAGNASSIPSENLVVTGIPMDPAGVDQPLFDTWMSFLETFPVNLDGMGSQPSTQCSTPAPGLADFNFATMLGAGMAGGTTNPSTSTSDFDAMMSSMFHQEPPTEGSMPLPAADAGLPQALPSFGDHLIDPNLLALSMVDQRLTTSAAPPTPASAHNHAGNNNLHESSANAALVALAIPQAASPTASGSSLGGSTTPGTPVSAGWELSMPGVYTGGAAGGSEGQGMWRSTMWGSEPAAYDGGVNTAWNDSSAGAEEGLMDFGVLPDVMGQAPEEHVDGLVSGADKGKGKGRMVDPPYAATSVAYSTPTSSHAPTPVPAPPAQTLYDAFLSVKPVVETLVPKAVARQLRREDIVRRAQERKRLIQQELDAVKMRLWGTTIEQAGLVLLAKKLDGEREKERRADGEGVVSET